MPDLALLTGMSTTCIVASGAALSVGFVAIKKKAIAIHRLAMLAATSFAAAFLVLYVTRWSLYGSKAFVGPDWLKIVYISVLLPHILLAIVVGPMALRMIFLAKKQRFEQHARLGRITVPIWLFVALSGWAVYAMLYR